MHQGEIDLCTIAATNPVALHFFDCVRPIDEFEIVEQALDAVRLLARDPRYTEAIHRRLKVLK